MITLPFRDWITKKGGHFPRVRELARLYQTALDCTAIIPYFPDSVYISATRTRLGAILETRCEAITSPYLVPSGLDNSSGVML